MKPREVIYWNQYSGMTEPFSSSDMKYAKEVTVCDQIFDTKRLVEKLLADEENRFSIDEAASFFDAFTPKMKPVKTKLLCAAEIVEITDDYIDIDVNYSMAGAHESVGKIKLLRKLDDPINGYVGKAAVIIHDVQPCYLSVPNHALGALAMAYGAYILVKMDGKWERINKSFQEEYSSPDMTAFKNMEKENVRLKNEIYELKERLKDKSEEKTISKIKYEETISEQRNIIKDLRKTIKALEEALDKANISRVDIPRDYLSELIDKTKKKKICFVGGTEAWQTKMGALIPNTKFVHTLNFNEKTVRQSQILVVNTNSTGHDIVQKAKNIAESSGIPVLYTSKNSCSNVAMELLEQLKNK